MSEFESVEEELKFMADISDDRGDSESSMIYMRYLGHIRTLAAQRDVLAERQDALIGGYESAKAFAEEYLTQRDELMQARNSLVENNDALHIQLAELRAQRDEGLAREAELRSEVERWQGIATYRAKERSDFIEKINQLSQSVAESVVLIDRAIPLVGEPYYSWMADAGVFVATHGPGCADGEKAE